MNLSGSPDLRMVVIILLRDVPRCLWQERLQTKVSQKSIAMDASDFVLLPGFRGVGSFGAEVRGRGTWSRTASGGMGPQRCQVGLLSMHKRMIQAQATVLT